MDEIIEESINEPSMKQSESDEMKTENVISDNEEDGEEEDETKPVLRRSQRQTKMPSYLDDYVLLL